MAYLEPSEFATKMVDAGEQKIFMSTKDTFIRAFMAGAILALAAFFAITVITKTGNPLVGAILFPVGFIMLYLMKFDLLTGVFTLVPLAVIDKRPGCTMNELLRNWGLVFIGNFAGALTVAFFASFILTYGYQIDGGAVAAKVSTIGGIQNVRLQGTRYSGLVYNLYSRHVVQLDGVYGGSRCNDIHLGWCQDGRYVDAHNAVFLYGV